MSEQFIYLTIDFVEHGGNVKVLCSISLVIFIAMYFIFIIIVFLLLLIIIMLLLCYYYLCYAVGLQLKVTNKPLIYLRAGYQFIIGAYFIFCLYVCTRSICRMGIIQFARVIHGYSRLFRVIHGICRTVSLK